MRTAMSPQLRRIYYYAPRSVPSCHSRRGPAFHSSFGICHYAPRVSYVSVRHLPGSCLIYIFFPPSYIYNCRRTFLSSESLFVYLTELRASQCTYNGVYMRTAIGNLDFSLTVLRLFDRLRLFSSRFLFTPVMSQSFVARIFFRSWS
jgi:hypothetical protein